MTKRGTKVLRARRERASNNDDSLLVRSAESLGRIIGSLQRQVKGTSKRLATAADDAMDALPELPRFDDLLNTTAPAAPARSARKPGTRRTKTARKTSGASKRSAKKR